MRIDPRKYLIYAIIGGVLVDVGVIYVAAPIVWNDPTPSLTQFAVWQVFWIGIGLAFLYLSRASKR